MASKPDDPKPGSVPQKDSESISNRKRLAMGGSPNTGANSGPKTKP